MSNQIFAQSTNGAQGIPQGFMFLKVETGPVKIGGITINAFPPEVVNATVVGLHYDDRNAINLGQEIVVNTDKTLPFLPDFHLMNIADTDFYSLVVKK